MKITAIDPQVKMGNYKALLSSECDNCSGDGRLGDKDTGVECDICEGSGRRLYELEIEELKMILAAAPPSK